MKSEGESIDKKRILSIIGRLLEEAPVGVKKAFPAILRQSPRIFVSSQRDHVMVVFLSPGEDARVKRCLEKGTDPFPGLIGRRGEPVAFGLDRSRCVVLSNNEISNLFAVSLGPDCSVLLQDHCQSMDGADGVRTSYTVPLAYVLSYGEEIKPSTIYDDIERLISHSIAEWTRQRGMGGSEG